MGTHTGITKMLTPTEYGHLWRRKNPERVREYEKDQRKITKKHIGITKILTSAQYQKIWKKQHPEKVKEYKKQYYWRNIEKSRAKNREIRRKKSGIPQHQFSNSNLTLQLLKKYSLSLDEICELFNLKTKQANRIIRHLREKHTIEKINQRFYLIE